MVHGGGGAPPGRRRTGRHRATRAWSPVRWSGGYGARLGLRAGGGGRLRPRSPKRRKRGVAGLRQWRARASAGDLEGGQPPAAAPRVLKPPPPPPAPLLVLTAAPEFSFRGGAGVLEPKSPKGCVPQTAQINTSVCKSSCFPTMKCGSEGAEPHPNRKQDPCGTPPPPVALAMSSSAPSSPGHTP